ADAPAAAADLPQRTWDRGAPDPAEPAAQKENEDGRADDVADRRGERDAPRPEAVEGEVEDRVQAEVAEGDPGRDPVRLQAEERAVQHQHEAVEDEARDERPHGAGDD